MTYALYANDMPFWRRKATLVGLDPDGLYPVPVGEDNELPVCGAEIVRKLTLAGFKEENKTAIYREMLAALMLGLSPSEAETVMATWLTNYRLCCDLAQKPLHEARDQYRSAKAVLPVVPRRGSLTDTCEEDN